MDDPQIDELCQRIYKNHRQALQMIYERVGAPSASLIGAIEQMILADGEEWHIFRRTSRRVDFVPREWLSWIPPLRSGAEPKSWITLWVRAEDQQTQLLFEIGPIGNSGARRAFIERLQDHQEELGLLKRSKITDKWTVLLRRKIAKYDDLADADESSILERTAETLESIKAQLMRTGAIARLAAQEIGF